MRTTWNIAKREFKANFTSPLAYVVICLSLVLLGLLFFFVHPNFVIGGFWQADRATLTQMFVWAPRLLAAVVVPVITMRLLAEEKRSGTLEMLITLPVKDHEVILGKFLGAWAFVLILIVTTALFPIFMFWKPWSLGTLDSGPVFSGYLGLILFSGAVVSIGLLFSALTESQVIAYFVTWFLLVLLSILGLISDQLGNPGVRSVLSYLSFDAHLASFSRGMIDTRDIVFFVSIWLGCLLASFWALERRKWA
jgi:ABC-2 type transport system permease protein